MLNISYNTTRLQKIINEFTELEQYVANRKAQNKGKAATKEEIQLVVIEYLKGATISSIAAQLFRSPGFVRGIVDKLGVPQRDEEVVNRFDVLPEQCVSEEFYEGQLAWSALYHTLVKVQKELTLEYQASKPGYKPMDYEAKYGCKAYQIFVMQDVKESEDSFFPGVQTGGFYGYALASELGSLEHLKEYGIDLAKV